MYWGLVIPPYPTTMPLIPEGEDPEAGEPDCEEDYQHGLILSYCVQSTQGFAGQGSWVIVPGFDSPQCYDALVQGFGPIITGLGSSHALIPFPLPPGLFNPSLLGHNNRVVDLAEAECPLGVIEFAKHHGLSGALM